MATFDVTLPINKTVVFPPRCVVCEKANPDGTIKLSILGANSLSTMDMAIDTALDVGGDLRYSGGNTLNKINGIPACTACASGLKWYHRLLKFATYTAWIPGLALLLILPGPFWLKFILLLAFALAPAIYSIIFPPSFGATFFDGKANFEFKSKLVAEEFLRLNSDARLKGGDKIEPVAAS